MLFKKKVKASLAAKIKSMVNGLSVEDFDITVYSHQCIAPTENTHKSGSIFLVRKTKLLNGKYQFKFRLPIGISEPCPRRVAFDSGIKEVVWSVIIKVQLPSTQKSDRIEVRKQIR